MIPVIHRGTGTCDTAHDATYDAATVRQLNALTSEFYAQETVSFSATRQSPWHGWDKAWNAMVAEAPALASEPLTVLDLGCGNLRFERFLTEKAVGPVTVHAFDNCPALADACAGSANSAARATTSAPEGVVHPAPFAVAFQELDLVETLLANNLTAQLPPGTCNLAVAFGIMHHLPTFSLRAHTLEALLSALCPGGFAIVSFWQFLNDERLAEKAIVATAEGRARCNLAPFTSNDYLLGWQHAEGIYRFCHHTPEGEIDELLATIPLPFREVSRFSADGRQGTLNRYVVLQRH